MYLLESKYTKFTLSSHGTRLYFPLLFKEGSEGRGGRFAENLLLNLQFRVGIAGLLRRNLAVGSEEISVRRLVCGSGLAASVGRVVGRCLVAFREVAFRSCLRM